MYAIFAKNKNIERDYEQLLLSLDKIEQRKLMTTLTKYPKSTPRNKRIETIGRVEKKGKFWQYYAPDGNRVIYDVRDRPKQVIVQFAGDHEDTGIWLRRNAQ
ncbi:hypothetical protein HY439_01320 [Candidatus Microgenomates bacterium]|nr:hypothetical protein [Candidatus Microgenomates bacterium]